MKFSFFTLGGRFFWEDVFYYQGWRIQRKLRTSHYRLLDSHNIRRQSGSFENCKDTLLKYISACEIDAPSDNTVILLHGFARSTKSLSNLSESIGKIAPNVISFNYCTFSSDLRHNAEVLLQFSRNMPDSSEIYFVTVGSGCLVLRKVFDVCDNYRTLGIKGIININPLNSGSDFAFLLHKFKIFNKLFGKMLGEITPDEAIKISKIPQDIPLYLISSPSKFSAIAKKMFAPLESFPQLSPPSESSYSQNCKEIKQLTWFPMQNENMMTSCLESLEDLMQKQ